jgi:hypothetical protein
MGFDRPPEYESGADDKNAEQGLPSSSPDRELQDALRPVAPCPNLAEEEAKKGGNRLSNTAKQAIRSITSKLDLAVNVSNGK